MVEKFGLSLTDNDSDKQQASQLDLNGLTKPAEQPQKRSVLNEAVHSVVGLVWHDENSKAREEVEHYAGELAKTVPLFMMGSGRTYAASALLYGLDQVHRGDSLQNQIADFGLGAVKGTAMKGTFDLIGKQDIGIAAKGLGLGISSRLTEVGLTRQTYMDGQGNLDLTGGLMKTAQTAFQPKMLAADVIIFGAAHGLFKAGNAAMGGALERSPLLSTIGMGGTFGFVSGTGAEMQRQADAHEQFDPVKAAVRGLVQAGVTGIASIPGGMQAARMQRMTPELTPPVGDPASDSFGSRFSTRIRTSFTDFKDALGGRKLGLNAGSESVDPGSSLEGILGEGGGKGKIDGKPEVVEPAKTVAAGTLTSVGEFNIGDQVRIGSHKYNLVGVDPTTGDAVIHRPAERSVNDRGWEQVQTLDGAQKLDLQDGILYSPRKALGSSSTIPETNTYSTDYSAIVRNGEGVFGVKPNPDWAGTFLVRHLPEFQVLPPEGLKAPVEAKAATIPEGEIKPGTEVVVAGKSFRFQGVDEATGEAVVSSLSFRMGKEPDRKVANLDQYSEVHLERGTYYRDAEGKIFSATRVPGEGYLLRANDFQLVQPTEIRTAASVQQASEAGVQALLPEHLKVGQDVRLGNAQLTLVGVEPQSGRAIVQSHENISSSHFFNAEKFDLPNLDGVQKVEMQRNIDFGRQAPEFDSYFIKDGKIFGASTKPDGGYTAVELPGLTMRPMGEVMAPEQPVKANVHDWPGYVRAGGESYKLLGFDPKTGEALLVNKDIDPDYGFSWSQETRPNLDGMHPVAVNKFFARDEMAYRDADGNVYLVYPSTEGYRLSPAAKVIGKPAADVTMSETGERLTDKLARQVTPEPERTATASDTATVDGEGRQLGKAKWKSASSDVPVEVLAYLGAHDGQEFVKVRNLVTGEVSETGIPVSEITFDKPAEAPKTRTVDIDVAPEKQEAFLKGAKLLVDASSKSATIEQVADFVNFARSPEGQTIASELAQFAEASQRPRAVDLVRDSFAPPNELTISVPEGMEAQFTRGAQMLLKMNGPEVDPTDYSAFRQFAQGEGQPLVAEMFDLARQLKNPALEQLVRDAYEMPREINLYVPPEHQEAFQNGAALLQATLEPGAGRDQLAAFNEFAKGDGSHLEPYFMELARQMGGHDLLVKVREAFHGPGETSIPVDGTDQYVFVPKEQEENFRKGIEVAKMFVESGKETPWFYDALKYWAKGEGAEMEGAMKEYAQRSNNPQLLALVNDAYLPDGNIQAPNKPAKVALDLRLPRVGANDAETQQMAQELLGNWQQFQSVLGTLPENGVVATREWRQKVMDQLDQHPELHDAARSYGAQTSDSQIASVLDYYFGTNNLATFPGVKPVDPFERLAGGEQGLERGITSGDNAQLGMKASVPGPRTVEQLISNLDNPDPKVQLDSAIHLKGQEMTPEQMKRYLQFLFSKDPNGGSADSIYLDRMHMPNSFILHYLRGALHGMDSAPVSMDAMTKILNVPNEPPAQQFPPLIAKFAAEHGTLSPRIVERLREQFTTGGNGEPRVYSELVPDNVKRIMEQTPEREQREDRKPRFNNRTPLPPKPETISDRLQVVARVLDAELPKNISDRLLELGEKDGRGLSEVMLYNSQGNKPQDIPNYAPEYKELLKLVVPQAKSISDLRTLVDALRSSDGELALAVAGEMKPAQGKDWMRLQQLISEFTEGGKRVSEKPFVPKGKTPPPKPQPKWRQLLSADDIAAAEAKAANRVQEPVDDGTAQVVEPVRQDDQIVVEPQQHERQQAPSLAEVTVLPPRDGVQLSVNAEGQPVSAVLSDGTNAAFKWTENGLTIEYSKGGAETGRITTSSYEPIGENPDLNWLVEEPGHDPRHWVGNVELGTADSTFEWWKGVGEGEDSPFRPVAQPEPVVEKTAAAALPDKVGEIALSPEEAKIVQAIRDGNKKKPDIASATGFHENIVKFMLQSLKGRGVLKDNGGGKYSVIEPEG